MVGIHTYRLGPGFEYIKLNTMDYYRSVKPQGAVQAFDPLCEVQSDKASVEITSPFDGVVKELLVQEGQVAKVGSGLCLIEVDEEITVNSLNPPPEERTPSQPKEELSSSKEDHTPKGLDSVSTQRRMHPLDPDYAPDIPSSNILATPSVRHFSRRKGVDLEKLAPGSGKGGRIEKSDVEAYLTRGYEGQTGATSSLPLREENDTIVELGRTRYGMWKAMVKVNMTLFSVWSLSADGFI